MPTVLIIDDEKDICQCVEDAFSQAAPEFLILKADNGIDGIEIVKKYKPDVILLDLQLYASLDGIEVFKRIKQWHPEGKVALLTGFGVDEEDSIQELGVDAYVLKPFTPPEIIAIVKKLIREKE